MGATYKWDDVVTLWKPYLKNIPLSAVTPFVCDMINSEIYDAYPWHWTVTNIPVNGLANATTSLITLSDGVQDYNCPPYIYRLLTGSIVRTDTSPVQIQDLNVQDDLVFDLTKRSYRNIGACSLQRSVGLIRLEAAVQVPSGVALSFGGDYQREPEKVSATSQTLIWPDKYFRVIAEGMLYWGYKLSDDQRAGGLATDTKGKEQATGQYGAFRSQIRWMMEAEDFGGDEQAFPSEPLGIGRDPGGLNIFGNPQ